MAISSPLLEASIDGAHGVLLSIQGGSDLGLFEINEAAQLVSNSAAVDANIIFGAVIDDALGDEVRVTVIAAGFDEQRPTRPVAPGSLASSGYGGAPASGQQAGPARPAASSSWGGARPGTTTDSGGSATGGHADSASGYPAPADPNFGEPYDVTTGVPRTGSSFGTGVTSSGGAGGYGAGSASPADPVTEVKAQVAAQAPASYVPAPVAFVTGEDDRNDDYPPLSKGGYGTGDDASGVPEKVTDVSAPRRRPVVFEEDDDLDVPDFLK
jgi:cell division protein FtsZ